MLTRIATRLGQRRASILSRCLALAVAAALAWPARSAAWTSVLLPALSPFLAIGSGLAARAAGWIALLALPVLALGLVRPRWFCRYGCPVGLLQESIRRCPKSRPAPIQRRPRLGPGLVLMTFAGAVLGYPLFLWLDPLAIFNGFWNAGRQPWTLPSVAAGLGLPLLLLLELILPRLWCHRVCPLGATQDGLAMIGRQLRRAVRRSSARSQPISAGGRLPPARRQFMAVCAGLAGAGFMRHVYPRPSAPPLRPPGAVEESRFIGLCVRCGNCAQACPSSIIRPDLGSSGWAGFLTPILRFDQDYCREDCRRCHQVCPSGAIARLSLEEKRRRVIGLAEVSLDACLLAQGRECTACLRRCPFDALDMHSPDGGFSNQPRVDLAKCNGCGACEAACPVRPARAIRVRETALAHPQAAR
ncbi:MAG TPA: 4Fe-4S dicluster domain-containing protein [Candidatus Paceibacterota bacterium]|nr:4Fe-4S dicluster domain-containing protein [Verrucomicrobiota bacterium]HRZ43699.1 4Fe-4S dicluster domain-containing protein [Candidatus Paceibacterota bacterium]